QHERADAVDQDVPDRADARDDALAHRVAGLHDAVGDAAAKSFWKNGQLCQRIRLVAPGTTALLRMRLSASSASGRPTRTTSAMATSSGSAWRNAASR